MLIQSLPHFLLPSRTLGLGLLLGLAACSDSDTAALPVALRADLQSSLQAAVENQITPGATLFVSSGDGESWSTSAGVSDVQRHTPMTTEDRFRAGSIIKTLVASAVLQDVERGSLGLDDVLTDWLPAAVTTRIDHAESIDVSMLLGHRSGIPEWDTSAIDQSLATAPEHVWTLDEVLDSAHSQPPLFAPGESFSYSNTNYMLLGEILSAVEGRSWREAVRERVIERAGLRDTRLPEAGDLDCPEPCSHGYMAVDGELLDLTRIDPSMAGPSGGHALLTSAADLDQLLRSLRAGDLFDRPETLAGMFAFQPAPDPEMHMTGYGFGVMQIEVDGRVVVGHIGGAAGYQSFMLYAPATDRYVSGFINALGDLGAVLVPILERVTLP